VLSRRNFLIQGTLGVVAVGAGVALRSIDRTTHATAAPVPSNLPTFDVSKYGALPNGTDATAGFQQAVNLAQSSAPNGGIVTVPPGTYTFTTTTPGFAASIQAHGKYPVYFRGAGPVPANTVLIQQVPSQALLSITTDGSQVSQLTLDCRTFTGGSCLIVEANNTTLANSTALGSKAQKAFTLWYAAPVGNSPKNPYKTPPVKNVLFYNNSIVDCTIVDEIEDDGISFSYQVNGIIKGVNHTGSRLAIYVCSGITVTDYVYTPNWDCNVTRSVTDGFYITPPSENITITNFTTYGYGGIIGGDAQVLPTTNVVINNHIFKKPPPVPALYPTPIQRLEVGTVVGLQINGGDFPKDLGAYLYFDPPTYAQNVTVQGPLTIPFVRFNPRSQPAAIDVTFKDVTFPALTPPSPPPGTTTTTTAGGPLNLPTFRADVITYKGPTKDYLPSTQPPSVTVKGGEFHNVNGPQPGLYSQGTFAVESFNSPGVVATATPTIAAVYDDQSPVNLAPPMVTANKPAIAHHNGTVLTAYEGAWSTATGATNKYTYHWNGASGPTTDNKTYKVVEADKGKLISVTVTAKNAKPNHFGTPTSATSAPVSVA
jgi:hypothetical protein